MNDVLPSRPSLKLTMRQIFSTLVAVVAIAAMLFWSMAKLPLVNQAGAIQSDAPRPMPVNVMTVAYVDSIEQSRTFTGTIRSENRSDLGFELAGKIKEIYVNEGDRVSEGVELAQLDSEALTAQKNAMLAGIEQAKNVLSELRSGPRIEIIKAARAARNAARSQAEMASANLERRKTLRGDGAISREEFDEAAFGLQTAQANLQAAEEKLAELEAGTRLEKVAAQKSAVKQLEASLEEIEVAITKSTLTAPFAGMITKRYLDPGSIAQASVPVVRLVDEQNLEAWIGLPVANAAQLKSNERLEVVVDGKPYAATLIAKIRELDQLTRTQTVVLKLDSQDSLSVVSGQLCELKLATDSEASGFWIPTTALAKGVRGLWSVMTLVPDSSSEHFRVEKRDVEILHAESSRVLVRGTLEDGDQLVADGVHRIANGQLVEIQKTNQERRD